MVLPGREPKTPNSRNYSTKESSEASADSGAYSGFNSEGSETFNGKIDPKKTTMIPTRVLVLQDGQNYKIPCSIGVFPEVLKHTTAVVDTGAGPNLIRVSALPHEWHEQGMKQPCRRTRIVDANGNAISPISRTYLICQLGSLQTTVPFIVVKNLAVEVILGCDYINQFVRSIRPAEGIIELNNKDEVSLIYKDEPHQVRLAQAIRLAPLSETIALAVTEVTGLCVIENRPTHPRRPTLVQTPNGFTETRALQPFPLRVANLGEESTFLNKGFILGVANQDWSAASPALPSSAPKTPNTSSSEQTQQEADLAHLEISEQQAVRKILYPHSSMWDGTLGEVRVTEHRIELQAGARPVYQAPYRAGQKGRDVEKKEVERMLQAGVIEPANSEWASPVVLITKKDGSIRFCVDYRKLNALTVRDTYPLPRMDDYLDCLGEAQLFTTLDCNSGYWQIPVAREDRDKTAFVTHCGIHRFTRMPFGLVNAPATFQRALDMIVAGVKWKYALVYLDDVIIYSRSFNEHLTHVSHVLELLKEAGISLKLKKCAFFKTEVEYLGHVITPGKLHVSNKNVVALEQAHHPRTRTELRSFLGMCNVYRKFVPQFAKLAAPLTELLKKGQPDTFDHLTDAQVQAFDSLRASLMNPIILGLPVRDRDFTLDVDASDYQLGACLQQEGTDGTLIPCGFYSRALNDAERNYSATEKECLAVVWAVLMLRPYLEGVHFRVRSDHEALRWLLTLKEPSGRLARWRLRLAEFDFTIQYRPGIKNSLADGCSRLRSQEQNVEDLDDEVPCFFIPDSKNNIHSHALILCDGEIQSRDPPVPLKEVYEEQQKDHECQLWLADSEKPKSPFFTMNHLGMKLLYHRSTLDASSQLCIPRTLRGRILQQAHHPPTAGHPGGKKMYQTLRLSYYWPLMAKDVADVPKQCTQCIRERVGSQQPRAPMQLFPAPGPLEFVAIDILGPLPKTKSGKHYILVIMDRFSKLARTVPLRNITANTVCYAFIEEWVHVYGAPSILLSDNGTQFTSRTMLALCRHYGIRQVFTNPYHPQTNGQVERFNKTLAAQLRANVAEDQTIWDQFTSSVTYAYNSQVNSSTGYRPFDLILTRAPRPLEVTIPVDTTLFCDLGPPTSRTGDHTLDTCQQYIIREAPLTRPEDTGAPNNHTACLEEVRRRLITAGLRYKRNKDRRIALLDPELLIGKRVFVRAETRDNKLMPKGEGPYLVISCYERSLILRGPKGPFQVSLDRVSDAVNENGGPGPAVNGNQADDREIVRRFGQRGVHLNH
jgi:transposase InsO family protein